MARRSGRLRDKSWPNHAALTSVVTLTAPFQDADPSGFVWHGNYFRYYDTARVELLRILNFGYRQMAAAGQVWPIVDTRVRYIKSIPFGTEIDVRAQLVEWEFRLKIYYEICTNGDRINEAYTVQVPVAAETETLIIGTPDVLLQRVNALIGSTQ